MIDNRRLINPSIYEMPMKRVVMNIFRIGISVGLLSYLIYRADVSKIYQTLRMADYGYVALATGIFFLAIALFSLRWKLLLRNIPQSPGLLHLMAYYLIGLFFNNFLPTTVGGDITRAYNAARENGERRANLGIVILERMLGTLTTLTLASISLIWATRYFHTRRIIWITVACLGMVVFLLWNLWNPALHRFLQPLLEKITAFSLGERLNGVLQGIYRLRESRNAILGALGLSLISQLLLIYMNYLLARALGLEKVTLSYLLLVVPITFVMGLIPSINGLGVRDTGYVVLLARIGLSSAEALSLSFLNTLMPLLYSVVGGILHLFLGHGVKKSLENAQSSGRVTVSPEEVK